MRTLEQRLDEIKSRGQKLIKKRNRRRAIAGVVCAATVCLGIGAFLILQWPLPNQPTQDTLHDKMSESSATGGTPEMSTTYEFSMDCPVKTIQITKAGPPRTFSDPRQLSEIHLLLDTVISRSSDEAATDTDDIHGEYASGAMGDMMVESENNAASEQAGYQILLTMFDGSRKRFTLEGDVLTDCNTNQHYTLTAQELIDLNELID